MKPFNVWVSGFCLSAAIVAVLTGDGWQGALCLVMSAVNLGVGVGYMKVGDRG